MKLYSYIGVLILKSKKQKVLFNSMTNESDKEHRWKYFLNHLRSQQWRGYILIGIAVYLILINQLIRVRPDHIFIALLLFALALGKGRMKAFVIDWSPWIVFWISYDMMRGVADNLRGTINVVFPYKLELAIFGRFFHGIVPAFYFQDLQQAINGSIIKDILDASGGLFYTLHFGLPILLGWVLWHTTDDRKMFYTFVWTMTLLNFSALATFILYPAAPPWYVLSYGFGQPPHTNFWGLGAGSLINVDKMIGVNFFQTLWGGFNPNHFAAIPSLHGSYPISVAFFTYKKFRRLPGLLVLYPLGVWFSAVYLNQHYIVDLIIGLGYLTTAYLIADKFLIPKVFSRFISWDSLRPPKNDVLA
ncbi:MAG: inositol phosphorylceramide synthase [Calditrichaeota bacterium]|nr:inositol phosphorylceramide synthase [Calditrichota bacterium]